MKKFFEDYYDLILVSQWTWLKKWWGVYLAFISVILAIELVVVFWDNVVSFYNKVVYKVKSFFNRRGR